MNVDHGPTPPSGQPRIDVTPDSREPPSYRNRPQGFNSQEGRRLRRLLAWLRPTVSCRSHACSEATVPTGSSLTGSVNGIEWGRTGGGRNRNTLSLSRCRPTDRVRERYCGSPGQVLEFDRVRIFFFVKFFYSIFRTFSVPTGRYHSPI